jgi:micrococcal nuclease
MLKKAAILILLPLLVFTACEVEIEHSTSQTGGQNNPPSGSDETGVVTDVIDGDTIDVQIGQVGYRVRYVGVNTPERDESCYSQAADANRDLIEGQTVRLVKDTSNTDRYGRLLRYVYVGNTFVNRQLVNQGWGEAVLYQPDDAHYDEFLGLEQAAANAGRGCHPTGIFDDGSDTR